MASPSISSDPDELELGGEGLPLGGEGLPHISSDSDEQWLGQHLGGLGLPYISSDSDEQAVRVGRIFQPIWLSKGLGRYLGGGRIPPPIRMSKGLGRNLGLAIYLLRSG